jgi:hypothetical protein
MICWLELSSSNVRHSPYCYLISSKASRDDCGKQGFFLEAGYIRDSLALSVSKSLIKSTWINQGDLSQAPNQGSK